MEIIDMTAFQGGGGGKPKNTPCRGAAGGKGMLTLDYLTRGGS